MPRRILLAALILAASGSSALAAEPLEGTWGWRGAAVQVSSTGPGTFHGVVVAGNIYGNPCYGVGTEPWSQIAGAGLSYSGSINAFSPVACDPPGPASQYSFQLTGPNSGSVCPATPGPLCEAISRVVQCADGADNDFDGAVDMGDPGCDNPADDSETPDPSLAITGVSVPEGAGVANFPITISPPSGRAVSATVSVAPGSATFGDFYVTSSQIFVPPGQSTANVSVTIVNDVTPEPNETFTVQLTNVAGARLVAGGATGTILNDDSGVPFERDPDERATVRRPTTTGRETDTGRGGSGATQENRAVCGVSPPTFPGKPKIGKDGRQRCPKARPKVGRRSRGGSGGVDRMSGGRRGDALLGLGGNDTLRGGGGGDRLAGGSGNDNLWGGSGGDHLEGGDGDDRLRGGAGSDWLIEERYGDDRLDGGPGDDVIAGNHGHDTINGGAGDDIISGGSGPDNVNCGAGYDTLYVNLNSDRGRSRGCERILQEADIKQRLCHSGGTSVGEQVRGGSGNDTCRARGGDDVLEGAGGNDRLYGDSGNDELFGRKGRDLMYGGAGNDALEGGQGADRMYGGPGNDRINGGFGRDRLSGGPGNDTLNAGWGDRGEVVDCGPGYDTFVYGPGDRARNCEVTKRG